MNGTFNELRLAGQFCDAILQVEDVQFPIHRLILCDCSPFFQPLFVQRITPDRVYHIPLVSPDIMQIIIEFAYTGSVAVTKDNMQELMKAADMLNIMGIIQACSNFIGEHICPQNCIGIWQFTDICPSAKLRSKVFHYIMEHFEEVVDCEEYLQLSVQELTEILGKDELNVKKESTVFDVVLRWIAHIPKEREEHIAVLLSKVRLGNTSISYIKNKVMTNQLVKFSPDCIPIVKHSVNIRSYLNKHSQNPLMSCLSDTTARPRLPHSLMWVSGGDRRHKDSCNIEVYDHLVDRWFVIRNKLEYSRAYHGTVFLDGYVYFVGGSNLIERLNSVVRLDLRTHTWQEMMFMNYRRHSVSVTTLNGFIYALGGNSGFDPLNTCERFCPNTNHWRLIAPMIDGRHSASCAVLDGKIYICGGVNWSGILQTVECYDPETNQWTLIPSMTTCRSQHKIVAYKNQIYVVGGLAGIEALRSMETYNPKTKTWKELSPMLSYHIGLCLEVINDYFYVIGGSNDITSSPKGEFYCPRTDTWRHICSSKKFCQGMSSCVVSGIPNMADYAFPRDLLPHYQSKRGSK